MTIRRCSFPLSERISRGEGLDQPQRQGLRPRGGPILASEDALLQRTVRNQCHIQLSAGIQHAIGFRVAMQPIVMHLVRSKWDTMTCQACMRASEQSGAVVTHAYCADLSHVDSFSQHIHQLIYSMGRRGEMDLIEVDVLDAQTAQAGIQRRKQSARGQTCWNWGKEAERCVFGRNDDGAAILLAKRTKQALIFAKSISLSSI